MEETAQRTVWTRVRAAFLRGLVIFIPVAVTVWFVTVLFNMIDGIIAPLQPVIEREIGARIPGLGVVTFVIIVFVLGLISRYLVGTLLLKALEKIFTSIPLVRSIYSATKDLLQAFSLGKKGKTFRKVVLVEYPRKGLFTIGFVTNEVAVTGRGKFSEKMLTVYILNPPNPTSGVLILAPESEARVLDMTVEEGLKLALSGGIVSPTEVLSVSKPASKRRRKN